MKARRSSTLLVLLACLIVSSPAFALDSGGPGLPPPIFDPCVGSSFTGDIGPITAYDVSTDFDHYYTATYIYDVSVSGNVVAHVITHYKRVNFPGSTPNVAMEDTFIDLVRERTFFGRSVHRDDYTNIGAEGVITGAVTFNGDPINVKGTYITTNFGGPDHFCAYLQQ